MKSLYKIAFLAFTLFFSIFLVGCETGGVSTPANMQYDGFQISWDTASNADYYLVKINSGEELKITTNYFDYQSNDPSFKVKVTSVNEYKEFFGFGSEKVDKSEFEKTFTYLPQITDLMVSDSGVVSWGATNGASSYKLRIDNVELSNPWTNTSYDKFSEGTHSLQVMPIGPENSGFYSKWSPTQSVKILIPTNTISYDGEYVYWDGVIGASGYRVFINGDEVSGVVGTKVAYDAAHSNFSATVITVGDHSQTFDSKLSNSYSFVFLGAVNNIMVTDGIVEWDDVSGATGYKIKVNNVILSTVLPTSSYSGLIANQSASISIMPITDNATYFSNWSDTRLITILSAPVLQWNQEIQLDDGTANNAIYWDGIANAVGYTIKVTHNGKSTYETFGAEQRSYANAFLEEGDYEVSIKANAPANSGFYDSIFSTKPIKVKRLPAPSSSATNFITSNPEDLSEGFTVSFLKVAGAESYQLYKDDVIVEGKITTSNQFTVTNLQSSYVGSEQILTFGIQSKGRIFVENNITNVVLNSLLSENLSFAVTILAMPTNVHMEGFNLNWNTVATATNYIVNLGGDNFASPANSYDLNSLQTGLFEIKVAARGNGSTVLASNFSPVITINRLPAPTNILIKTQDQAEGVLSWDEVLHAISYKAVIDTEVTATVVNNQTNISQYIKPTSTSFHMQSVANYYQNQDVSTRYYYMTSVSSQTLQVTKLNAPTFSQISIIDNTKITWNAPSNLNQSTAVVTYNLYNSTGLLIQSGIKSNSYDLSGLNSGVSYTFTVKAVGDGMTVINSPLSSSFTVYKIGTPSVTVVDGKYTWSSVPSATGYAVFVDGILSQNEIHQSGATYSFTPSFTVLKTYQVKIIALGNGVNSIDSTPYEIQQATVQLTTPDFSIAYSESSYSPTGEIRVAITTISPNANGYTYIIGGVSYSSGVTFSLNPNSKGLFLIGVFANGGTIDANGVYYLKSQIVGNNSGYSINILSTPTYANISLNIDGQLSWSSVTGSLGYEYAIAYDGGTYGTVQTTTQLIFSAILNGHTSVKVKIRAMGNGTTVVTSEWIEKEFIIS